MYISMYVHCAAFEHHRRIAEHCSTYISLVGFSLITRGWPLAFFACLINECQLGCLSACLPVCDHFIEAEELGRKGRTKLEKMIPLDHTSVVWP